MISSFLCFALSCASVLAQKDMTNVFFYETFDEEDVLASKKWVKSSDEKYDNQPVMIKTLGNPIKGFESNKGLLLSQEMKHYGISSTFPVPLEMEGRDLVLQYELKLEEGLTCGGAYIKLPRISESLDLGRMNADTPYSIMFGPDKCGNHNKIHFIIQHLNPVSGLYEEKAFNTTIGIKSDKRTHLYTLFIKNNNDFEIYIDKKVAFHHKVIV
mmetsp:Transcript_7058/g.7167  ORF Transcript_7058/g.7167 Transcript_7058/m.7167 type:complete len:213 (-) Transcript_7058:2768-3406(-)